MSTPLGRLRLWRLSMVLNVVSLKSIRRLWMLISYWSRESLCLNVLFCTVNLRILVGSGVGPWTTAPVRSAVSMIFAAASSRTIWSKALKRIRIDSTFCSSFFVFFPAPCTADSAMSFAEAFLGAFFAGASVAFLAEDIDGRGKEQRKGADAPFVISRFSSPLRRRRCGLLHGWRTAFRHPWR